MTSTTNYTYDANGKLIAQSIDSNSDGITDSVITYSYNLTFSGFYSSGDDIPDFYVRTFTYYANGYLNKESNSSDYNGDGIADRFETSTYDAKGQLISSRVDSNGDGIAEYGQIYIYDANGTKTYESPNNKDNRTVLTEIYGRTSASYDFNNDGAIDAVGIYSYDFSGNLKSQEIDNNNDGIIDELTAYSYDANGKLTAQVVDKNNDGIANEITTYNYNPDGKLTSADIDHNHDGIIDAVASYLYDANDQLISTTTNDANVPNKTLNGGNCVDKLFGRVANDKISGKNGNDQLFGLAGNDKLVGGNGNDILNGGAGNDILTGGNGADKFVFNSLSDSLLSGFDRITDLNIGEDKIDGLNALSAANLVQLGTVASLNIVDIQQVLTTTAFVTEAAATFTFGTGNNRRTFLALNDNTNGFSALTDGVIEISGYKGNLTNLAIV
ncbi:Ca2+-binding protein, RTX toxin-related [Nostoc flagelliforme CCNUN1]|uniref:Ca2+-binding protein, RTX toxin-related n=1 Tax=Nostoc flagelliforme CCNUN1 TaxID=2038116 RepID=A0A2K8SX14_9NOSO|nr:bluetail domain-containing putative surface protein [Nostoc flagelliforme]AUB39999.1 Ca2+-binding protein, RTX toxin-related [Nostoc flagelliforme CCNUN1]